MNMDELEIIRSTRRPLPSTRDLVAMVFRQRRAMLIAFFVAVAAVGISGLWVPKYEATMKILVQRQRTDAVITSSSSAPLQFIGNQVTEEDLNSEVELLNSEDLLRKVVVLAGLEHTHSDASVATAAHGLAAELKIEPLRKSNVISVRYQSRDPQKAAAVLKAVATAYQEKHLEVHRATGEYQFFDQQTNHYREGLAAAQQELSAFTTKSGVVQADSERDAALRQASEFEAAAHQAQTEQRETEQRVSALQSALVSAKPRMTTAVRTSDNPQLFQQLKATLLNLEIKRTELLTKYAPENRLVKEVDDQIAQARTTIDDETKKPLLDQTTDRDPDYEWIRQELTKAQANLVGLRSRASAASAVAAQYRESARHLADDQLVQQNLLRDAKTQEENYLLYVHKREEARINDDLDRRGILNVAVAEEPMVPAVPKRSPISMALMTLLLAGTFSLSSAFVLDSVDPSFRTPDELADYLGVPVLAALPRGEA